jgi:hypothetical protein
MNYKICLFVSGININIARGNSNVFLPKKGEVFFISRKDAQGVKTGILLCHFLAFAALSEIC